MYENVTMEQLETRDEAEAKLAFSWLQNTKSTHPITYSASTVRKIADRWPDAAQAGGVLEAFREPVAELTEEDFFTWVDGEFSKQKSWSRTRQFQTLLTYNYTMGARDSFWREDMLAARQPQVSSPSRVYGVGTILYDSLRRKRDERYYVQELIMLQSYLYGEGQSFTGSFGEYLNEEVSSELQHCLNRFTFAAESYENIIAFGRGSHVASFRPAAQRRVRALLLEQNRAIWTRLVTEGPRYRKGKSFTHLQNFLREISHEQGVQREFPLYSAADLRRDLTLLIAEGILFEGPAYDATRLHGLATTALRAVPTSLHLETYAPEYSHILHLVQKQLKEEGRLTLMQTVGFLFAMVHPRTWMRGPAENGPYLLVDLLQAAKPLVILNLLSELIFGVPEALPTEKEWRRAIGEPDSFTYTADFFLPLMVSPAAMEKRKRKSYPEIVAEGREYFGIKR